MFARVVVVVVVVVRARLLLLRRRRLRRPSSSTVIEKQTARASITVVDYDRVDTPCVCVSACSRRREKSREEQRVGNRTCCESDKHREREKWDQPGLLSLSLSFSDCTLHSAILFPTMFTRVSECARATIDFRCSPIVLRRANETLWTFGDSNLRAELKRNLLGSTAKTEYIFIRIFGIIRCKLVAFQIR